MPWVNHIANPGGEYASGGSAVFWRAVSSTVTSSTDQALDGTASVKLVADAASDSAAIPFVWPGNDNPVLFQAYVYHPSTPGGDTQLSIRTTAGASIAGIGTRNTSASGAWTRLFGTATPSTPLVAGSAYWLYIRAGAAGTVYIDRAAVWQGVRDDALAWSAQVPLFVVEVAPGYGAADLYNTGSPLVAGAGGSALAHRVGTPWIDVTWRVRRGSTRSGRSAETEQTSAAEAFLTLDNRDGALDPTTGTMGTVGMPLRVRIADPSTGRLDYLFEGQAWSVAPRRQGPNDQVVDIGAVDRWKTLGLAKWRPLSNRGEALAHLAILYPAVDLGYGRLTSGTSDTNVMGVGTADDFTALDYMQQVARSDGGRLVDHPLYGTFVEGRRARFGVGGTVATFGTAAGQVPYTTVEPVADDSYLWNDWTVTGNGGSASSTYTDATSGSVYGYRSQQLDTRIGSADASQVTDAAAFYSAKYAYPRVRIPTIEPNLAAIGTAAPWRAIVDAHRDFVVNLAGGTPHANVFVVKRPVIGTSGGTATHEVWPEGCSVEWGNGTDVRVRLDVSPAQDGTAMTTWWRLGEGQLDSTTRLAW